MTFVNFRKKFRFFSFDFCQNFDVRTFPRWLSIRGTKIFWWAIQKICFSKIFTLVLLVGFLDDFWKFILFLVKICILIWYFWVFFENYSMRMLSIRGNNFIACWAYAEPISSHTEHTRNIFPRMLSQWLNVNSFYMYKPCWAFAERILLHTEQTLNEFHRMLSILETDFIACWACAEMFKSQISRLNRMRFSKISCHRPLGPYGFGFCKKVKKNVMLVYL
jgi:hypothetical protein